MIIITSSPPCHSGIHQCLVIGFYRSLYGEHARRLTERTNEAAGVYAKECLELAEEMGLRSINLWSKFQETEGWQKKLLRFVMFEAYIIKFLEQFNVNVVPTGFFPLQ